MLAVAAAALYWVSTRRAAAPVVGPAPAADLSRDRELTLGHEAYRRILGASRVVASGPLVDAVRDVGTRLAAGTGATDADWEFTVVDADEPAAFCLPGGKVVVSTGLARLTETTAGLAVAMGHVIAHAIARHGAARIAHDRLVPLEPGTPGAADLDVAAWRLVMGAFGVGSRFGVLRPFSAADESAADHMGLLYVARACVDPAEVTRFWDRIERTAGAAPPEFLTIHPDHAHHLAALQSWMSEARAVEREHCPNRGSE